jgi:thiamine biosynthesis protein ThiI
MALFIVRYGEVALKSKAVRRRFEAALRKNIVESFIKLSIECRIELDWGRVYIWSKDEEKSAEILKRTFGVVSFSRALECSSEKEDIYRIAVELSKSLFKNGMSFRVKARRTGQHEYTSMELAKEAGSAIWLANESKDPRVDLTNPDLTIHIEVRQDRAYIFNEVVPGPGGLPLGTQGRILGLITDKKGVAACWMMMKRGCSVTVSTDNGGLIEPLKNWDPHLRTVESVQTEKIPQKTKEVKAEGLVLGWNLAEFDDKHSQIEGITLPIFCPIIGLSESEVDGLLRKI